MGIAQRTASSPAGNTSIPKARLTASRLIWGRMEPMRWPARIIALLFVVTAIASMSFSQLGFWSIGEIDGKPVYLMLILAPLSIGAMLFGPIMGGLLGLFAGAVVLLHATELPLDYYEIYYMSPLNSVGLLFVFGFAIGFLFLACARKTTVGRRVLIIVLICLFMSFAASFFSMVNIVITYGGLENIDAIREYLFNTPLGVAVQALVDAAAMIALCILTDAAIRKSEEPENTHALRSIFQNWLLLIASIVFMGTSAAIFSAVTVQDQSLASQSMSDELEYLQKQLNGRTRDDVSFIIEGYTPEADGVIAILDEEGNVIASDSDRLKAGGGLFVTQIGYPELESSQYEILNTDFSARDAYETVQALDENGRLTLESVMLKFAKYDEGYIAILYHNDKVYADRLAIMASSAIISGLLIVAISILAIFLLNRVVVRRIDETNSSLGKITDGDLNERVRVKGSREFSSLSSGINTTVSALREYIAEAERRNAQELLTAQAIQESALPREFPPFPDIDRFDIYASMKMAKEVGGDFYDFFLIDEGKLGFVIADVSGKGIPASLFMMAAKTQIRNYMESGLPVDEAINAVNHQLCIGNDAGMFVTMFACLLDYETGELSYVNAGHNPPLIQHAGKWTWLRAVSGMPLGLFDGMPYDAYSCELSVSDVIYLYTDGVTEAMDKSGELFGENRLEETLNRYTEYNPRSLCVGIRRALTDFTQDADQSDDITMLCLKYGVPPEKNAVMILDAEDYQLIHVCNFIHAELHRRGAPSSVRNQLDIAAEELFVNVCHYAYPNATPDNPGKVKISFEYELNPPSLTVVMTDEGIPYNPLEKPDAVTPDDIEEVPIGGLGILMAKRSVDFMDYKREGNSNVLTFRKGW